MKLSPCKGCVERCIGCHAKCESYINWKKDWDAMKAKKAEEQKKGFEYIRRHKAWEQYQKRNRYRRRCSSEAS